ncbi:MAG TPA: lysophospholipid acyltransferase family protein [Halanaerobiaceae bacterium]|nr:lysophospholipid acyltransferase family protein [Halanaerobiaceae bacterium]
MKKRISDNIKLFLYPALFYLLNLASNWWTRLEVYGKENLKDISDGKPALFAVWHGKLWIPLFYFRGQNYLVLASSSRDGEYISRVLRKYGYQLIRGSSSRGGGRALLSLVRRIREGDSVFITPDGPTGPIHKVKPGTIYLQEKTGVPIIPVGVAIERKKTFASWDRLNFPLPGTRATLVIGEQLILPADRPREERLLIMEEALNRVEKKAAELL